MANKTKSTGYTSSKTKGKFKWGAFWAGLTAFVFVVSVIFTFFAVGTTGFKDWSFSRVFPKTSIEQNDGQTSGAVIGEGESNGISLMSMAIPAAEYADYGIERTVQNAYTVTATFTPEGTTYQEIDYSLYFYTGTTEYAAWAQGKNIENYASVTPASDGSKEAVVTVKQAFSAPIMVKATSRRDSNIYATIRADYIYSMVSLNVGNNCDTYDVDGDIALDGRELYWEGGTIAPNQAEVEVVFFLNSNYKTAMKTLGWDMASEYREKVTFNITSDGKYVAEGDLPSVEVIFRTMGGAAAKNNPTAFWNDLCRVVLGNSVPEDHTGDEIFCFGISYARIHNGVDYGGQEPNEDSFNLTNWSGFEIKATNITVTTPDGGDTLVFG